MLGTLHSLFFQIENEKNHLKKKSLQLRCSKDRESLMKKEDDGKQQIVNTTLFLFCKQQYKYFSKNVS